MAQRGRGPGRGEFVHVGRFPAANRLSCHAETGDHDVDLTVDLTVDRRSPSRPMGEPVACKEWRLQIQGPRAWDVIEKAPGSPLEQLKVVWGEQARLPVARHGATGSRASSRHRSPRAPR